MARLSLRLHGTELYQLRLEDGREYIAGRGAEADIQLPEQRGISRQHLKFYDRDGVWVCETLSKFIQIQRGSEAMNVLELNEACVFSVTPFEFSFEPTVAMQAEPVVEAPAPTDSPTTGALIVRANNDATIAGGLGLVPYLRISYPNSTDDVTLKLEGQLWMVGRDSDCEIPIESPSVSRKHFELARTNNGYFITDFGSSNGTKLNGQRLAPHEPTPLVSGDDIRVMNVHIIFEIRDTQFAGRIDRLPAVNGFDPLALAALGWPAPPMLNQAPQAMMEYRPSLPARPAKPKTLWQKLDLKKNKVRLILAVLVPVAVVVAMIPDKPAEAPRAPAEQGGSPLFEKLTKEQKLVVKDSFNLARTLYTQGKYSLCLTELAKLHELLPIYENSTELQSFCEQGQQLKIREADAERMKRERERIENQVQGYVETCKAQLGPKSTVDETRQCLSPAIELAPEHALVIEMLHSAQMHEEEQKFMDLQKHTEDAKAAKGRAHFERAMAVYKTGELLRTIEELKRFINTSYPHASDLKDQATRKIASIEKEVKQKVDAAMVQCDALGGKSQWREAYKACDLAVKEDPDNKDAKSKRAKMLSELRKDMKNIYEDSVLEESLGNVDSAKEKWKKIIQEDLSFDDYTIKSKSKLSKYGVD